MGTRSEIRFYKNRKLGSCTYHHYDGYPEHIMSDLITLKKGKNIHKSMKSLSKLHGTSNPKCAYGDKSNKTQGDIEYSYKVGLDKDNSIKNVKIFKCDIFKEQCKEKIFDGNLVKARKKFKLIK